MKKTTKTYFLCVMLFACYEKSVPQKEEAIVPRVYFLSENGDDHYDGSKEYPWKTISRLNEADLNAGDTVYLKGGEEFSGTIMLDHADCGTAEKVLYISTYGDRNAVILSKNAAALTMEDARHVTISRIDFSGSGRKNGNQKNGISIINCSNIIADSLRVSGFQKSGLLVYSSSDVKITRVRADDNGFAGIHILGDGNKKDCRNIYIGYSSANNNAGDPTVIKGHSGNGILAGICSRVLIEYCSATNNGWDMQWKGNGPVGIWTYESDSVTIQHCTSFRNRTSPRSMDGGGFDLDGGVTNSILQDCLSYENEGSGIGIFQYAGASKWNNNIIRNNISRNDGTGYVNAGVLIWNSSGDAAQFSGCRFYGNKIINEKGACIKYDSLSAHSDFQFYDNIMQCKQEIIRH